MTEKDTTDISFPSDKIGIEEEFLASEGAHVEDHEVRSSVFGTVYIDKERYRASVQPFQKRRLSPKRFDEVIGTVIKVSKSSLRINLNYLNNEPLIPAFSAIMHISDAAREYISSLDDFYAAGDILRATVIDSKTIPLQLECKKNNSGVIFTICEQCGANVKKIQRNVLRCKECEHTQRRKTAIDYGNVSIIPKY